MKLETYKLTKPYPVARLTMDGKDVVCSIGKFYFRIIMNPVNKFGERVDLEERYREIN